MGTDFTRLEEELTAGKTRPFYLLFGDDGYLIERAREKIIDFLLPRDRGLNFTSYDAHEAPPHEVINACNTLPCIAQRRVVLVNDAHHYGQSEVKSFLQYLRSPSLTTSLVFIADEPMNALLREIGEGAFHLRRPSLGELPYWIQAIARAFGKEISPDAVKYLQEIIGRDLQGMQNELFKISLYIGDKKRIEATDVEEVVSEVNVTTIFELTKALGECDIQSSLRAFGKLWESGEHYLKILAMIARQFRHLLMTKYIITQGGAAEDIKKQLGISNQYYLRELSSQSRHFSQKSLQGAVINLWETDLMLKKSSLSRRLLLEGLIIRLCRAS